MTFTAIDELPLPPAPMVEDAKKDDLAEAHSLLPQLWTIREFRKIALPIVLGAKSKTGAIMRDAIAKVEREEEKHCALHKPYYKIKSFSEAILFWERSHLCDAKRNAAKAFQEKQLEKIVAFKNGKVPKNRANAVKNVARYWKPQTITEERYWGRDFGTEHPESWLDAHGIPRNREGLKFNNYGYSRLVYGDTYIKQKHFTMWDMLEYWKKNFKYAEPGLIVGWDRKISEEVCSIY